MGSQLDDVTLKIINSPKFEIITTFLYSTGLRESSSITEGNQTPLNNCYLLDFGLHRLRAAAVDFSFAQVQSEFDSPGLLEALASDIEKRILEDHPQDGRRADKNFIVRLAYGKNGEVHIMTGPRPRIPSIQYYPTTLPDPKATDIDVPVVDLFVDPGRIEPTLFTKHKTTFRDDYSDARARVGLTPTMPFFEGEVLLVNQRDEVLGGGFTTVYFWRNGSYVTPASSSGAKIGVSRQWALENIDVQEGVVLIRDVLEGEHVWLSSAVSGFCRGKVRFVNEAM